MLVGTYELSLDPKKRMSLPAKVRNDFKDVVYLTYGTDGCIEVRSPENYETYFSSLVKLGSNKRNYRMIQRAISGNTFETKIDNNNRILLSDALVSRVGINRNVVLVGVQNKLEIWDAETYKNKQDEQLSQLADLMEELDQNEI